MLSSTIEWGILAFRGLLRGPENVFLLQLRSLLLISLIV